MKRFVPVVLAAALAVTLAGLASAAPHLGMDRGFARHDGRGAGCAVGARAACRTDRAFAPRLHRREMRQQMRIRHGQSSGRITPGEARWLRLHGRHIRAMEWRARRDGDFSLRERARVHRALDRQGQRIRRMAWNGRSI